MPDLGRISGKLLTANLLRNGIDLTFRNGPTDPDLMYLDVNNLNIGVNTDNPLYDVDINGLLNTTNVEITNSARFGTIIFNASGTITTSTGSINIVPSNPNPEILHERLLSSNLEINDNFISTLTVDTNLNFDPSGTGFISLKNSTNVLGNIQVNGDINITGDLGFDGTIQFGNNTGLDNLSFASDFTRSLIPATNNSYDFGSLGMYWASINAYTTNIDNLGQKSILVGEQMYIADSSTDIRAVRSNDSLIIQADTNLIHLENLDIQDDWVTNLNSNGVLEIVPTGTQGYVKFDDNNAFVIPVGTTAERGYTEVGETRWNSELGYMECFDGTTYYVATGPGEFLSLEDMDNLGLIYSLILG